MIPYRLGTTSYIIPDELLPNVRYLAGKVQDVQLILFDLDDGPSNLPAPGDVAALKSLGSEHGFTFSVHLPLDVQLGDGRHPSLLKARRVIECTRSLNPWAIVLHLDGRPVLEGAMTHDIWVDTSLQALELLAGWAGGIDKLALENLEGYPLDFWDPVLARSAVSRCVDIGHLWLEGHDPAPFLQAALPRTRIIHLHGIGERDHQSLQKMSQQQIAELLGILVARDYDGVLTLEVFNQDDFEGSLACMNLVERRWKDD